MRSITAPTGPQKFETCPEWGARITPLFQRNHLTTRRLRQCGPTVPIQIGLPIFTRISYSMDARVPPVFPQCVANIRNDWPARRNGTRCLMTWRARGLGLRGKRRKGQESCRAETKLGLWFSQNLAARPSAVTFNGLRTLRFGPVGSGGSTAGRSRAVLQRVGNGRAHDRRFVDTPPERWIIRIARFTPGPQESIPGRQFRPIHGALQNSDLVAQRENLQLGRSTGPKGGRH